MIDLKGKTEHEILSYLIGRCISWGWINYSSKESKSRSFRIAFSKEEKEQILPYLVDNNMLPTIGKIIKDYGEYFIVNLSPTKIIGRRVDLVNIYKYDCKHLKYGIFEGAGYRSLALKKVKHNPFPNKINYNLVHLVFKLRVGREYNPKYKILINHSHCFIRKMICTKRDDKTVLFVLDCSK